nr:T6SS effector amidase Tae4 family protein [Granulicella arctica]
MRMSWMLNHVHIPIPGPHHSVMLVLAGKDVDGHKAWYAIRHAEIRQWLTQVLGPPQISKKAKPVPIADFAGHKGIIVLDVAYIQHPGQANATGHIDLWDGSSFSESSERGKEQATFNAASRADLWIAPD